MNERIKILYDEYPGDGAWEDCVKCVEHVLDEELERLGIEKGAVSILFYQFGDKERILEWINRNINALGGKSPKEILEDENRGKIIFRTLLMRMH